MNKIILALLSIFGAESVFAAGEISKVQFNPAESKSSLVITYSGKGKFRTLHSEKKSSVIIEGLGIRLPARLSKSIDSSSKAGSVVQITPYQGGTTEHPITKFVVQLRGDYQLITSEISGKYIFEVKKRQSLASDRVKVRSAAPEQAPASEAAPKEESNIDPKNTEEITKKLIEVLNSPSENKSYFGKKIKFDSVGANVFDIFSIVGLTAGLNIVADSDVKATASYSLNDIPWDQLLDITLQQARLKAVASGNVVRIMRVETYEQEQQSKMRQISMAEDFEPVVMGVIPLSFAVGTEMKKMIESLLVKKEGAASDAQSFMQKKDPGAKEGASDGASEVRPLSQAFVKGKIEVDERSNSLIVTNTKASIERIRRLVKELDVALPQILIDAKIVIASEKFSKTLGMSYGGKVQSAAGRAGAALAMLDNTQSISSSGSNGAFAVSGGGGLGFGFQLGAGPNANLNATLQLAETNGLSKTIASPRLTVNNKVAATISDGQKVYINTTSATAGGAITNGLTSIDTALALTVTPQVTNAGSVLLKVNVSKSSPEVFKGGISANSKSLQTEVLVDSGNTLVLGGVYQLETSKGETGIPLLKDLPFIGQLFRTDSSAVNKNEMMVFITPQIMEPNGSAPMVGNISSDKGNM